MDLVFGFFFLQYTHTFRVPNTFFVLSITQIIFYPRTAMHHPLDGQTVYRLLYSMLVFSTTFFYCFSGISPEFIFLVHQKVKLKAAMHHHFSLPAVCRKKGPVLSTIIQLDGKADQTNLYAHPYSLFALLAFSQIWYLTETFSKKHYICTQTCLRFRETDLSTKQFARLKSISSLWIFAKLKYILSSPSEL